MITQIIYYQEVIFEKGIKNYKRQIKIKELKSIKKNENSSNHR
jgi:hypothetical protein